MEELSERDIQEIVGGIPSSNLVLFCPGLQGHGSTLIDRSQSANNGTISGATWKRRPSGLYYLSFDGANDYVTLGATKFDTMTSGTIFAIVKLSALTGFHFIFSHVRNADNRFSFMARQDQNHFNGSIFVGGVEQGLDSTTAPSTTDYQSVVFVFGASGQILYVNGTAENTQAGNTALMSDIGTSVSNTIGDYTPDSGWAEYGGDIGMLLLTGSVLSPTEISRLDTRLRSLF